MWHVTKLGVNLLKLKLKLRVRGGCCPTCPSCPTVSIKCCGELYVYRYTIYAYIECTVMLFSTFSRTVRQRIEFID